MAIVIEVNRVLCDVQNEFLYTMQVNFSLQNATPPVSPLTASSLIQVFINQFPANAAVILENSFAPLRQNTFCDYVLCDAYCSLIAASYFPLRNTTSEAQSHILIRSRSVLPSSPILYVPTYVLKYRIFISSFSVIQKNLYY